MTDTQSRRALLGGLAALPALTVGAAAAPLSSDLVHLCDFAVGHANWINATAGVENWGDAKLNEESDRY